MATVFDADDFNAESTASKLNEAMKGWGSKPEIIISAIGDHTFSQRQAIAEAYKNKYEQDLVRQLKYELRGDFEEIVTALMTPPPVYDARTLNKAMKGPGTSEDILIEIMCSRSKDEIEDIKAAYQEEFEKCLEEEIGNETSGYFEKFLKDLASGARSESSDVDEGAAKDDAKSIHESAGKWESGIINIFCTRSFAHLRVMFKTYANLAGKDIEDEIREVSTSNLGDGLLAIVRIARSRIGYFAEKLYSAMKGYGTDEQALIRIVVSRSEIDLACIKPVYYTHYGKSLSDAFKEETSGDYMNMLIRILGTANASN